MKGLRLTVAIAAATLITSACSESLPTAAADLEPSYAASTAPGQNKLRCFSGTTDGGIYGGKCKLINGGKGGVQLDNTGGDPDGSYSGAYILNNGLSGQDLSDVSALSFNYTGVAGAGAPRISLPISEGGYAFLAAYYCNDGNGLADFINDETCTIWYNDIAYANWAAFVAAFPEASVGSDLPFIISDEPGSWTITNVDFGGSN